ncbi:MAG: sensor histidine kinase [Bacteroidota bacterium]
MNVLQKIAHFLGSRVALNLYFWAFLLGLKLSDADDQTAYSPVFYYGMMVFYMSFFALLSYVNNLILLPRYLFRKKRLVYFGSVFAFIFAVAYVYTFLLKWLPTIFPGFDSMSVSIVMSPISQDISPLGILFDLETYFFMMVIWTVIFTLLGYYHNSVKKVKLMEDALIKHRETELNFLKNQINPHFLFNTLNNLYALALKKSDEAPESILKLSSVLRYVLYEADAKLVAFDKERDIMQSYIDIELLRLPDSPHLQFSITSDRECMIPPLIWLPIIENVFKHNRQVELLEVDFQFSIQQNQLRIYCKNNTTSKPQTPASPGGIGLSNLRQRLALLYPERHNIEVTSTENYFIIEVNITLS